MLEIAIAAVFLAVAFVAVGTSSRTVMSSSVTEVLPLAGFDEPPADLPCPWCQAPPAESDSYCPSCGQPFG